MSDYRVKKGIFGSSILYDCPNCGAPLTSSVAKAGSMDNCPDCARAFTVPGMDELKRVKRQMDNQVEKPKVIVPPKSVPPNASPPDLRSEATNGILPEFAEVPEFIEVKANDDRQTPPPDGAVVRPIQKKRTRPIHQFGDSLLELAFTAARIFSVFVIVGCSVATAIIAIMALSAVKEYREVDADPLTAPSRRNLNARWHGCVERPNTTWRPATPSLRPRRLIR